MHIHTDIATIHTIKVLRLPHDVTRNVSRIIRLGWQGNIYARNENGTTLYIPDKGPDGFLHITYPHSNILRAMLRLDMISQEDYDAFNEPLIAKQKAEERQSKRSKCLQLLNRCGIKLNKSQQKQLDKLIKDET